ncbi:type 1 glutamine amidotransferase [Salinibacterium sp. GXW1014]|uniref:type 1 glutamine amidotransferase n=1 Tax=Salinibacterium sp. GXW1014 TaxID=3377838 RepID=UPI00383BECDD
MTQLTILELFPEHLAVNGDMGNVIVLRERLRLAGIDVTHVKHNPGDDLPDDVDIVTVGTGPASALRVLEASAQAIGDRLRGWRDDGVPMLAVTAGMQLLGSRVTMPGGAVLEGAGVLAIETDASADRVVTNCFVIDHAELGRLIGVENHGSTMALTGPVTEAFGTAVTGRGNGHAKHEGARAANVIGTHLQGPVLAMNPVLADHLIELACERKGISYSRNEGHAKLDSLALECRRILARSANVAVDRPAS